MVKMKKLVKSVKIMGELLPVILDADNKPLDGLHRLEINPNWKTEKWSHIKTKEDKLKAKAHLNYARRGGSKKEKIEIINGLAEWYEKQGLQVAGKKPAGIGQKGGASSYNEIVNAVINALDGAISRDYIGQNIDKKYLQIQKKRDNNNDIVIRSGEKEDGNVYDKVIECIDSLSLITIDDLLEIDKIRLEIVLKRLIEFESISKNWIQSLQGIKYNDMR